MFDESQVKAVLQRAVELDAAKAGQLSREELLQVAAEAGVSRTAVEQAMAEQRAPQFQAPSTPSYPIRLSVLRLMNLSVAAGVAGGLLSSIAWGGTFSSMPVAAGVTGMLCFGALFMVSGALALSDVAKPLRRYVQENIGVWLGFGFGGVLASALMAKFGPVMSHSEWVFDTSVVTSITGFVITTVVGSALFAIRRSSATRADQSDTSAPGGPAGPLSPITRGVLALRRWVTTSWRDLRSKRSSTALPAVS